jgi:aryl-alcohol dehydrogenase-like predicted oxidoreductase
VSALSLGGGGIGRVYGEVEPDEAMATVRAAVDAGIDLIDLAPTYGPGEASPEAELRVARAFEGSIPEHVRISSKVLIEDPCSKEAVRTTMRSSLEATLRRLGRDHLDLFILHSYIRPAGLPPSRDTIGVDVVRELVRLEFEELVREGLIRGWGLTGTAATDPVCELLEEAPTPTAVQCVTNAVDLIGNLWPPGLAGEPDNARIRRTAAAHGVCIMGIRALAAGALSGLDRDLPASDPAYLDAARAAGFRLYALQQGVSAAYLAHRYALSLPDVGTLVIGAKTRRELDECLAAERVPQLTIDELEEIEAASSLSANEAHT